MNNKVFPTNSQNLKEIFPVEKPIIGMLHLKPLPGSPHYKGESIEDIIAYAVEEAITLEENGIDGIMLENHWDLPFSKPEDIGYETVSVMTAIGRELKHKVSLPIGVNVLANAVIPSLAIAKACDAAFVRSNQWVNAYVANEGIIDGASAKALRYRAHLFADEIQVMADVHAKHGSHSIVADRSIEEQTKDNEFFAADILIATGSRTGDEADLDELSEIKNSTSLPVIVGSGMTPDNAEKILEIADGAIIGSYIKDNGKWWGKVDAKKVQIFMEKVNQLR